MCRRALSILVSCPRNKHIFRCDQNGPAGKAVRAGLALEGAYLNRYVTDEQRSRRPIFIAPPWAAANWLFFRVAHSSRIDSDVLVVTASPARTALKNSQLTCGESHAYFGDRTLALLPALGAAGVSEAGPQTAPPAPTRQPIHPTVPGNPPNQAGTEPAQTKIIRIYRGDGCLDNALAEKLRSLLTSKSQPATSHGSSAPIDLSHAILGGGDGMQKRVDQKAVAEAERP